MTGQDVADYWAGQYDRGYDRGTVDRIAAAGRVSDPWSTLDLSPLFSIDNSQGRLYGQEDAATRLARAREDLEAWEGAAKMRSGSGLRSTIQNSARTMGPRQRQIREWNEFDQARIAEERRLHERAIEDASTQMARAQEAPVEGLNLPGVNAFVNPGAVDGFIANLFGRLGLQMPFGLEG